MESQRLNIGVIGLGGFAGEHHAAIAALEASGECRLVCACDPFPDRFAAQRQAWEFERRGAAVYTDYLQMLDAHRRELDLVTVPTPVPLHAPMYRACLERGLACYLEKPPTLYYAELDDMIAADATARKGTHVGFLHIVEPHRQALKRRILDGAFGNVLRVSFYGYGPRASTYFARAPWAGRLMMDGRPVLDSCVGNAQSHYVHNLLFWAGGGDVLSYGEVASVRAELYRAHDIEGADTVFVRGTCTNGVDVRIAASHACAGDQAGRERVECEKATISHAWGEPFRIDWADGRQEIVPVEGGDLLQDNLRAYFYYLRGDSARPLVTLTDTRPFVQLNDLAYIASDRVTTVPAEHVVRSSADHGRGEFAAIEGIADACDTFVTTARFPSEQEVSWAKPGGLASLQDLPRLMQVVRRMAADRAAEATA